VSSRFPLTVRERELWAAYIAPATHLDILCEPTAFLFVQALAAVERDPRDFDMLEELHKLADALWLVLPNNLSPELQ
jgi:hypothetical protein